MLSWVSKRVATAALALFGALSMAAAPASAEPALWVVRDADSTVYLFGTIHVLRPETEWRTPKIDAAYRSARELWIETSEGGDPAATQALVVRLGASPTTPLSSRLTPPDRARLTTAAAAAGLPAAALEPMRPWLAALTLTVAPVIKAGYDPAKGVDKVLEAQAKADGKPVRTFETMEQQFRFFADLPEAQEMQFLRATLDEADDGVAQIDAMAAAWAEGDIGALERTLIADMRRDYPQVYDLLLKDRNVVWAKQIQQLLAGSGVHFIAVGAGHLVGPDSVQAQLRAAGIGAARQ
jgi:uncharacterized protein YbaP (TraB family)